MGGRLGIAPWQATRSRSQWSCSSDTRRASRAALLQYSVQAIEQTSVETTFALAEALLQPLASVEQRYIDSEVLKANEVAEILRMEERLVYDSITRGEIPGVRRFGKRRTIRVSRRLFFDWLNSGTPS
jgi:hypothetical protein